MLLTMPQALTLVPYCLVCTLLHSRCWGQPVFAGSLLVSVVRLQHAPGSAQGFMPCPCQQEFFGDDCSSEASHLEYGVQVYKEQSNFEYDFFQLPDISPAMLTHSVEVRIRASYWSTGYGEWAAARPELLLLKVRSWVERCSEGHNIL